MAQQVATPLDKNDPELRAILAEIEADADNARVKAKIPGLSIVIVHDQDVLLAKGFGYADLEKKIPADPQTVYRTGSVTKVFTALMLMQLRDAGKLHLDDPIEKFLPEFKIKSRFPDARPATFRQVAAHRESFKCGQVLSMPLSSVELIGRFSFRGGDTGSTPVRVANTLRATTTSRQRNNTPSENRTRSRLLSIESLIQTGL